MLTITNFLLEIFLCRRYFATIFAISYAIFLVIFGAIAFIGDAVSDRYHPIPEVFCIFMLSVGMAYFLFLYIDIRIHVKGAKAAVKEKERRIQAYNDRLAKSEGVIKSLIIYIKIITWN